MSESDESEEPEEDAIELSRYNNIETRKQIALAKYHGLGEDGEWTLDEIAEYLECSKRTVERYVYESDMADEVEEKLADAQARTRMRLAMKLLDRLDTLEEMIEERRSVKEPEVASHKQVTVQGDVVMSRDGMSVGGDNTRELDFQVPVPDQFIEVTEFSREMEGLLREWRQTLNEVEDLLGLEAPESKKIEEEHREISIEGRVFQGIDHSGFPEAKDAKEEVEEEMEQIDFEDD